MLILGIDTATVQVGCAIGGHEGVLASTQSARGKRHAESLTPAIEFICRQARIELSEISVVAVDLGPGPVHRPAGRRGRGQGHGPRAAGADDRRAEPRPAGLPGALQLAAHRGRHRRPAGRAVLRVLPPGARRHAAAERPPRRHRRRPGRRAAGVGRGVPARRRRRHPLPRGLRRPQQGRDRGRRAGPPVGVVAGDAGPRPGPARAVREAVGPHAAVPAQARRRDQLVDAGDRRDGGSGRRPAPRSGRPGRHVDADAAPPPPGRAAHRGPSRSPWLVARAVHGRAGQRARSPLPRGQGRRLGGRLRRHAVPRARRPHHHHLGRSGRGAATASAPG